VRGIAGRPDRDAHLRGELVVLDARDQTIDHPRRVLVVGVEQHHGEGALVGVADEIRVADLLADDLGHLVDRPVVGGHQHAVPLPRRFHGHEREIVLGPHRALELGVQNELERAGRQEL